ncbi:hypothetical protein T10_3198 [Trichinella papuae]|uniref:Uncharacterized protein n=1 Tax=Trichinella papuae TaxID=268474 RepID=A0A0V1MGB3_9BILA|nr:hypothetical protein T10_3198 [Trichinella papuae]
MASCVCYVFTQILRYSHAVLDCASLRAHILRFQIWLPELASLPSIQESRQRGGCKPPVRSASFCFAPISPSDCTASLYEVQLTFVLR